VVSVSCFHFFFPGCNIARSSPPREAFQAEHCSSAALCFPYNGKNDCRSFQAYLVRSKGPETFVSRVYFSKSLDPFRQYLTLILSFSRPFLPTACSSFEPHLMPLRPASQAYFVFHLLELLPAGRWGRNMIVDMVGMRPSGVSRIFPPSPTRILSISAARQFYFSVPLVSVVEGPGEISFSGQIWLFPAALLFLKVLFLSFQPVFHLPSSSLASVPTPVFDELYTRFVAPGPIRPLWAWSADPRSVLPA